MGAICIETATANSQVLRSRLLKQIENWRNRGLLQDFNEINTAAITIWDCQTTDNYQARRLCRLAAQMLADYIVSELEPGLVQRLIALHHPHFNQKERDLLTDKVRSRLLREEALTGDCRRQLIARRIEDFLASQGQINIEGFIRFRLQDYHRNLVLYINECADDHMMEREYQDFINLLKYFVEIQQPKYAEVHLVKRGANLFLYDNKFKLLHKGKVEEIEGADAIISSLVTASPKKVVVHVRQFDLSDELLSTLNSIFESRVVLCLGCDRCDG